MPRIKNEDDAKREVNEFAQEFARFFRAMQKKWMALEGDDNTEKIMKKARVWGAFQLLGKLIDDEGPVAKKFDSINNKNVISWL